MSPNTKQQSQADNNYASSAQLMTFILSEFPLTIKTYLLDITVNEALLNNCKEDVEYVSTKGN